MKKLAPPNYTQVPNWLLDRAASFDSDTFKILCVICRATFGYHRKTAVLTLDKLAQLSGVSRRKTVDCVEQMIEVGYLQRSRQGKTFRYCLKIARNSTE